MLVDVIWNGEYAVTVNGALVKPGDTFQMPEEEAHGRIDVTFADGRMKNVETPEGPEVNPDDFRFEMLTVGT